MAKENNTAKTFKKWFNKALFNTDSASQYFETLVEGIDPMWSLESTKARVNKVHLETKDALTINMTPTSRFNGFSAGQHVQLSVEINGARKTRTFSLSSSPTQWRADGTIEVTIKAIDGGLVTRWIHEHIKPGDIIRLGEPQGEFLLPTNPDNIVYVAGGSGITPIMSHIRSLLDNRFSVPVTLLYYAKTRHDFIFEAELQALAKRFKNFSVYLITTRRDQSDDQLSGHLEDTHLQRAIKFTPQHLFVCGPQSLQDATFAASQRLFGDTPTLHKEHFGLVVLPRNADKTKLQSISLNRSNKTIECDSNTTLLDSAEQNGLSPNHGCRMGICYTCKCKKRSGVVRNAVTGQLSGTDEEDIQLCVSIPETPVELDL